ncbi:DUF2914 domain-containing protein [Kushneria sp. AK178]
MTSASNLVPARLERLYHWLRRYSWLWPLISFGSGLFSFFLISRQQDLGAWLALALMLTWLLLSLESLWSWWHRHREHSSLPRLLATFCAQLTHQETLFFCLPFFLITTVWRSGQAIFTGLLVLCAIVSIVDPLYFRIAEKRRWLYFSYHALCVFAVLLVVGPLLLRLSTGTSLLLAAIVFPLIALPSLISILRPDRAWRWLALVVLAAAISGGAWAMRTFIPPATLWIDASALSPSFDTAAREPQGSMALTADNLRARGLYAFTAVHAPLGLNEHIRHVWRHNGQVVDEIELTIQGGRDQGYRAWSRKQHFGPDSEGAWQVDVVTDAGQRLGVIRFDVVGDADRARRVEGRLDRTPGIGWLRRH